MPPKTVSSAQNNKYEEPLVPRELPKEIPKDTNKEKESLSLKEKPRENSVKKQVVNPKQFVPKEPK